MHLSRAAPSQGSIATEKSSVEEESSADSPEKSVSFPTRPQSAPPGGKRGGGKRKAPREPGVGLNLPRDGERGYSGKGGKTPTKGQVRDWLIDLLADAEKATLPPPGEAARESASAAAAAAPVDAAAGSEDPLEGVGALMLAAAGRGTP